MSKFFRDRTYFLYLDQFAISEIFKSPVTSEWLSLSTLIKRGITEGKLFYANSIEQMIETTGMDKERATQVDNESRKFSSNWWLLNEVDITSNYILSRIRNFQMSKTHFCGEVETKDMEAKYEYLQNHNRIFREMIQDSMSTVNTLREAARTPSNAPRELRDFLLKDIKNNYAQTVLKRLFWLGYSGKFTPTPTKLGSHTVPHWADVLCSKLVEEHSLTQVEAQAAFWVVEKEGVDAVPTLSIRASLEAMMAYKGVEETPSEQVDVIRIASVLPFADMMLIDSRKAADLRELGLDTKFGTKVYSGRRAELSRLEAELIPIVNP